MSGEFFKFSIFSPAITDCLYTSQDISKDMGNFNIPENAAEQNNWVYQYMIGTHTSQ